MSSADLDRVLYTQSGETLLGLIDRGTSLGQAIVERATDLYVRGLLPERLGFCVDQYLESSGADFSWMSCWEQRPYNPERSPGSIPGRGIAFRMEG